MQVLHLKENDRLVVLEQFRKKFAASSLYLVFFSLFILLNACVCFSSQPYYDPHTNCYVDDSEECQRVKRLVRYMYGLEVAISIIMVTHGCLTMALADNLKTTCLVKLVLWYCKAGLFLYPVLLLCRCAIYAVIENNMQPLYDFDWFGGVFAIIFKNQNLEIVTSTGILTLYFVCYLVLIFTICLINRLNTYIA